MNHILKFLGYPLACMLLIITIGFAILAGTNIYHGCSLFFNSDTYSQHHSGVGIYFIQSIDFILGTIVSFIMMAGIASLFNLIPKQRYKLVPEWLQVQNIHELKMLLWETLLLTLVVYFISIVFEYKGNYEWETLILPGSILLLSLGYRVLKHK